MSAEREIAAEDSIRVVCRFRPLNDSEEKAGSKVIVKFPNSQEENCISIGVSTSVLPQMKTIANYKCVMETNIAISMVSSMLFVLNVYSSVSMIV